MNVQGAGTTSIPARRRHAAALGIDRASTTSAAFRMLCARRISAANIAFSWVDSDLSSVRIALRGTPARATNSAVKATNALTARPTAAREHRNLAPFPIQPRREFGPLIPFPVGNSDRVTSPPLVKARSEHHDGVGRLRRFPVRNVPALERPRKQPGKRRPRDRNKQRQRRYAQHTAFAGPMAHDCCKRKDNRRRHKRLDIGHRRAPATRKFNGLLKPAGVRTRSSRTPGSAPGAMTKEAVTCVVSLFTSMAFTPVSAQFQSRIAQIRPRNDNLNRPARPRANGRHGHHIDSGNRHGRRWGLELGLESPSGILSIARISTAVDDRTLGPDLRLSVEIPSVTGVRPESRKSIAGPVQRSGNGKKSISSMSNAGFVRYRIAFMGKSTMLFAWAITGPAIAGTAKIAFPTTASAILARSPKYTPRPGVYTVLL